VECSFQLPDSSWVCKSCKSKLTAFAEFKREVDEKHRTIVKLEQISQEPEHIDFISIELNDIKQEVLEPECVVENESSAEENFDSNQQETSKFICTEENCSRDFFSLKSLITHKNRYHGHGVRFWCCKCEKVFKTKKEMLKCQKVHVAEDVGKAVECPECFNSFSSQGLMISHRNKQHGSKIFFCKPCNISYESKEDLVRCQKLHYSSKIAGELK
jgi:uncharacterized C2H2 Zn-finger protein